MINIKNNLGQDSVSEANIREVCKDILEQAKSMYVLPGKIKDDSGKGNTVELPNGYSETYTNPTTVLKRKELEREGDNFLPVVVKRSKQKVISNYYNDNLGCKFSLKRDGPKWNPERIKSNTLFIMGSRANKVLGMTPE